MLTSTHNPRVKAVRALLDKRREREEQQSFVVEGVRLVEAALDAGAPVATAYVTSGLAASPHGAALLARLSQVGEVVEVSEAVLRAMSDTETPQGVVAVVGMGSWPATSSPGDNPSPTPPPQGGGAPTPPSLPGKGARGLGLPAGEAPTPPSLPGKGARGLGLPAGDLGPLPPPLLLVVDGVRDPGNLGTLLRSAAAVGVDEVWLAPGTVDLYNPKVVRAGMGAHFQVAARHGEWPEIEARVQGLAVRVAEAAGHMPYYDAVWSGPAALVVGGEAEGVSALGRRLAVESVFIPMRPGVESLNAAMAATVILFEANRQRQLRNSEHAQNML